MANRTDTGALQVRGTNPQFLIDKILRNKIYNCRYWKEFCTGLTAESLVDEAIKIEYVGGGYGGTRAPTKFICLILKLLQIAPEKEIILEYIRNPDYKYVTVLAMFYLRLIGNSVECYSVLEEYLQDYRKIRYRNEDGSFQLTFMDEFADNLLRKEVYCSTVLPKIQTRIVLEENEEIPPRVSLLEKELERELEQENQNSNNIDNIHSKSHSRDHSDKDGENKSKRHSRSRSSSKDDRKKSKKHKKDKKKKDKKDKKDRKERKEWRKVVKGKHRREDRDRRSYSTEKRRQEQPEKKQFEKGSIEAENELRAQLGIPLLPV